MAEYDYAPIDKYVGMSINFEPFEGREAPKTLSLPSGEPFLGPDGPYLMPDGSVMISGRPPPVPEGPLPPDWESHVDPLTHRTYYINTKTKAKQWTNPLNGKPMSVGPKRAPEPHPQAVDEEPDWLVLSYPRVEDDSKPDLADHRFAGPLNTVLQAPAPRGTVPFGMPTNPSASSMPR